MEHSKPEQKSSQRTATVSGETNFWCRFIVSIEAIRTNENDIAAAHHHDCNESDHSMRQRRPILRNLYFIKCKCFLGGILHWDIPKCHDWCDLSANCKRQPMRLQHLVLDSWEPNQGHQIKHRRNTRRVLGNGLVPFPMVWPRTSKRNDFECS